MIRVLLVCMGNICRSPMAEAVLAHLIKEAGLSDKITLDSAGTGGWHVGEPADPRTLAVLKKHGIAYAGHARQLQRSDFDQFDYILAMDTENLSGIRRVAGSPKEGQAAPEIALFLSYANAAGLLSKSEVPDPYYNNQFDAVYELVSVGSKALLDHLRQTHAL